MMETETICHDALLTNEKSKIMNYGICEKCGMWSTQHPIKKKVKKKKIGEQ